MTAATATVTGDDPGEASYRRRVYSIAISSGIASFALNFWYPFMPLYMRELGATSDANALAWVAAATTAQGLARIIGGPLWGMLSDRVGRKPMFIRAMFGISLATAMTAMATAPWMMVVTLGLQGAIAGFTPASVALTSVSVPRSRLTKSLAAVQIAQSMGRVLGPGAGALLVAFTDYRGAFFVAAALPAITAFFVIFMVPKDALRPRQAAKPAAAEAKPSRDGTLLGFQFLLTVVLIFALGSMNQVVSLFMPTQMRRLVGDDQASTYVGVAFTISGLMSIAGAVAVVRWLGTSGRVRRTVYALLACGAAIHFSFIFANGAFLVIGLYALMTLISGAMVPTDNMLIAANVTEDIRGRAFGWVSSAQAASLMIGPITAASFAALSLDLGYATTGTILAAMALVVFLRLREPDLRDRSAD